MLLADWHGVFACVCVLFPLRKFVRTSASVIFRWADFSAIRSHFPGKSAWVNFVSRLPRLTLIAREILLFPPRVFESERQHLLRPAVGARDSRYTRSGCSLNLGSKAARAGGKSGLSGKFDVLQQV